MRKSKFTHAQIVAILREAEAGMAVAELLRKHGISRPTFYLWKQKFGGAGLGIKASLVSASTRASFKPRVGQCP